MSEEVTNHMEICVDSVLSGLLKKTNACSCQKCANDVKAFALNNLPPKYIVTSKGLLYTKLSELQQQFEVDIMTAITKGVEIVSKNPRHCDNV